jgi:hypothetical protein
MYIVSSAASRSSAYIAMTSYLAIRLRALSMETGGMPDSNLGLLVSSLSRYKYFHEGNFWQRNLYLCIHLYSIQLHIYKYIFVLSLLLIPAHVIKH